MGEAKFLEEVGGFYQAHIDGGATAQQFVDHFKSRSPVNLDRVFEEWVFTPKAAELLREGITLPDLLARYHD